MTTNSEEVKKLVRERYGARARGVIEQSEAFAAEANQDQKEEACCDPGCCGESHADSNSETNNQACCAPSCCGEAHGETTEVASSPAAEAKGIIQLVDVSGASCDAPGCCGPEDLDRALQLYQEGQIAGLPAESVAASAGCGNPTALAGLKPGERVLDLGSGGGIDCFLAAQQVGETGHVTGLDMTPDMLELARKNQANLGLTNVEFIQGELEEMPIPDASVDVIISNCVVCLSPDKDAVFSESYRVLTPGGRIHLSDMMSLSSDGPSRTDPEAWAACIAGAEDRDVYLGRLRKAGFVNLEITEEKVKFDQEEGMPLNVASVKVVATKA